MRRSKQKGTKSDEMRWKGSVEKTEEKIKKNNVLKIMKIIVVVGREEIKGVLWKG